MSDKRQRARVQGSWAQQKPRAKPQTAVPAQSEQRALWAGGLQRKSPEEKGFEFQRPAQLLREIPPERLIDSSGDYEISSEPSGVSRLCLIHNFLSTEEADWMFSKLLHELPWSQKTNYRLGEAYEEPRLTCWFGDLPYTYSHSTMNANTQWPSELLSLRSLLHQRFSLDLNSVLCNLYRSGHDSIGWHSDDEASLGEHPTIASISLGDTRVFSLRKKPAPEEHGDFTYCPHIKVPLSHGTLLIMEGATQDDWQHQVAKEYHDRGPRINLTFRTIHQEPEGLRAAAKTRNLTHNLS
ncbi:alpha-ketoglutarate-dependent dioxygenase alkB homolog 3 [Periophthalmus magnuspinnatus]|uniref:alpha-ketoglutarate-dependent dioxygenase alkB homolog 3 n=1 Tax=Periophthalmus magnuspinnatus TaxID=409849 RepID=UPI00145BE9CC|nr:alpha-ketoglutarate-dependent dioxygenase alkB homolog 3 [Periophthalmus magnuspinnatus]XP_055078531.1 alpha-ketoglutarate-dependent dioxygenase alkB homolog 3 [Periophthalmus magnuspinnatus]